VAKTSKYHLSVHIDKLTNSILNTISGDSFPTEINQIGSNDLKNVSKKNGWNFNWGAEFKLADRKVYKLTITGNANVIRA